MKDENRPLRGIDRVVLNPILFHCTYVCSACGMVRGYCGDLSGLLGTQLGRLCLLAVLTPYSPPTPSHPPTPLYAALVIFQAVFKMSLKTSQSSQ